MTTPLMNQLGIVKRNIERADAAMTALAQREAEELSVLSHADQATLARLLRVPAATERG